MRHQRLVLSTGFIVWLVLLTGAAAGPPAAAAPAAPAAPEAPLLTATGAFFALSVADLDASARWYRESLGLRIVLQPPKQGKTAVVVLEGNGLLVELLQDDDATPKRGAIHGLTKAGIIVADFDRTLALLGERQVRIAFGPYPASATQRANVIIQDNSGNLIQIFGRAKGA
jgi:catechol 2,3-dioxygenase-like lactoylglutathione lyase family enzyme